MYAYFAIACSTVLATVVVAGDREVEIKVDGTRREYRLHLPPCYDGCTQLPVILAFHGMSANAKLLQRAVELDATADKLGFITVYPNGTGVGPLKGFKAGASEGRLEERKPDDVRFVHAILNNLERTVCMDPQRVYATGLSNGAMMCYRLAAEMPQRIAAVAPVSGGLGRGVCPPSCPVSVIHFHGTCDDVLPFAGPHETGLFKQNYYSVPCTIQMFANAAGCVGPPQVEMLPDTVNDGTCVVTHLHTNVESGAEVMLVEIRGGGHQWPMQPIKLKYLGTASMEIDANEMMCCFFLRHTLADCNCATGN